MGVLSILLGLALTGIVADFVIENDIATAATQPFQIAGTTQELSVPVLVAIAFGIGALGVVLIVLGIRSMRRGRRKTLQQRIRVLQDENARLHSQRHLQRVVRIPESEPVVDDTAGQRQAATPEPESERPASKW